MTEQLIYDMLRVVAHNGDLMSFVSKGYEFSQLTTFFDDLQSQELICFNQGILSVTRKGKDFISDYEKTHGIRQDSKWLLRQEYFWHEPLSFDAIYVP